MARVIFDGLTIEQARQFVRWFKAQGEADLYDWVVDEEDDPNPDPIHGLHFKVHPPMVNTHRKPGWQEERGEDVVVHCHTP